MKSDFCFKKTSEKLEKQWKCGEGHYYKGDNGGVRNGLARSITQRWFVPSQNFSIVVTPNKEQSIFSKIGSLVK